MADNNQPSQPAAQGDVNPDAGAPAAAPPAAAPVSESSAKPEAAALAAPAAADAADAADAPAAPSTEATASGTKREADSTEPNATGSLDAEGAQDQRPAKRARNQNWRGRGRGRARDSRLNRGRGNRQPKEEGQEDNKESDEPTDGPKDGRKDKNHGRNFRTDRGGRVEGEITEDGDKEARLPKRKVVVQFGYCGNNYSGLQINPGVQTIEGDLFDSFCALGAISAQNAVNPAKVNLQRSARTDRGVHAAGNLISLKLIVESPEIKDEHELVKRANETLPEFIRIWSITRVQSSFDARLSCDSRMYEYLLPTHVFIPPKPGTPMYEMAQRMRDEAGADVGAEGAPGWDGILDHPFWREQGAEGTFIEDLQAKRSKFRLSSEQLARIRATFDQYLGSHNYHNFTVEKPFTDRSAQRFMKKLTISDPFEINGTEWVSIKLHGQSFMLHQIRKMIAVLVLVCRMNVPPSFIAETFGPAKVHTPKAPALGLLLERPLFGGYNRRVVSNNQSIEKKKRALDSQNISDEQKEQRKSQLALNVRDPIMFDPYEADMEAFKHKFIYEHIFETEQRDNEFGKWLNFLDVFKGTDFEYLNPKGVIPQSAIQGINQPRKPKQQEGENGKQPEAADTKEESEDEAAGDDVDES